LTNRLRQLVNKIDSTVPAKIEIEPMKKEKGPYRLDLIRCLAEAWCEITGKPVPRRKNNRETGKPEGEFYEFIAHSLELIAPSINADESLKDIQKYNMGKLVPNKNQ
jgi:hypothetical protein